jgi:hypothetical protein
MAYASITYTSASGTTFALTNSEGNPIQYLRQADIAVTVNGVLQTLTTNYTFNTAGTAIVLNSAVTNATVVINRTTSITDATVSFTAGSTLTAQDLNNSDKQNRFALQEFSDTYGALTTGSGDLSALAGFIGSAETWLSDNAHAPTTGAVDSRVDSKIDTALTTDVVAGDSITVTDNSPSSGQITIGVTNNGISTAKIADSAVTTAKLADNNVTTAKIADSNVTTAKIADDGVTTVKVADNAITSAKIADGTIIAGDIAADAVTTAKILNSNVTTAKIADLNVTTAKVADGAITDAKVASGIDGAKLTAGSIPSTALADTDLQTLAGAQTGAAAAFAALTATEVGTLDGITSTTAELNILDGVTADANEINRLDGITTSTSELNQLAGKTITGTLTPGNTNDIPTSFAVNNWVIGLVDALGGFVAIANEVSFPNSNPDPSDNPGTVVSVADAGGLVINGSGISTSAQTVSGSTVTITGFPSSLYSTTLPTGVGIQVQTTATLNTYTYHKIIAREEDVIRLTDDINDFFARYRVGTTNPTIDLDAGDLFFNTTTGKMLVYDGLTSSWEEVQSIGNFFINTLSSSAGTGGGSASFNSTAYRFTLSNPPLFAQQLLVSINGVVQKPNSGTAQPAEGFVIDGNDIVFSQAPATSSPFFIVTLGSTVNIGTPSDDTVSTAKIQNGAVTTAKLSSNLTVDLDSGTAAAPSLTFDANTGLYSPGADQVAISTNGSGRLYVDASGNVGINKFALSQTFHVLSASGGTTARFENSSTGNFIDFFETGGGTRMGYIGHVTATGMFVHNDKNGPIVFDTNNTERMRLDSSGRLGLGTSSPSWLLQVAGNAAVIQEDSFLGVDATTSPRLGIVKKSGASPVFAAGSATAITFSHSSASDITGVSSNTYTPRLTIDTSGRVGIGTTTVTDKLTLAHSDATGITFKATGTDGATSAKITFEDTAGGTGGVLTFDHNDNSFKIATAGTTERARIDSSGRLLVGTSSTSTDCRALFQARSGSSTTNTTVVFSGGNSAPATNEGLGYLAFSDSTHTLSAWVAGERDGGTWSGSSKPTRLVFSTTADGASSPTERMRIGNQGTTTVLPAANLNAIVARARDGASSGGPFLYLGYHSATDITNGTYCYSVATNGNVQNTNGSYTAISDARLKENIVDASSQWDDLKSIKIRNWNFKEETGHETHRQIGPIAQELEQVCPGLVFEAPDLDEDGNETGEVTKGVNQSVLYMKAVKALQEAMERIEVLEQRLTDAGIA